MKTDPVKKYVMFPNESRSSKLTDRFGVLSVRNLS